MVFRVNVGLIKSPFSSKEIKLNASRKFWDKTNFLISSSSVISPI